MSHLHNHSLQVLLKIVQISHYNAPSFYNTQ
jgi:hypothetical protein